MKSTYSVTFEFETRPPQTHRGTVVASQVATCVARATREAQKALKPSHWSSMVCVLLDRQDTARGVGATHEENHPPICLTRTKNVPTSGRFKISGRKTGGLFARPPYTACVISVA